MVNLNGFPYNFDVSFPLNPSTIIPLEFSDKTIIHLVNVIKKKKSVKYNYCFTTMTNFTQDLINFKQLQKQNIEYQNLTKKDKELCNYSFYIIYINTFLFIGEKQKKKSIKIIQENSKKRETMQLKLKEYKKESEAEEDEITEKGYIYLQDLDEEDKTAEKKNLEISNLVFYNIISCLEDMFEIYINFHEKYENNDEIKIYYLLETKIYNYLIMQNITPKIFKNMLTVKKKFEERVCYMYTKNYNIFYKKEIKKNEG